MATVVFTDAALDDLRRFGPVVAPRVVRRVLALERDPALGEPLVDPAVGFRVLTVENGLGRVVYNVVSNAAGDVVTVDELWAAGTRLDGEAYAEALERMQSADQPDLVALARILGRLGRITGSAPVPRNRLRQPVPDWLARALVASGAVDLLTVAAMDAATAFDAWNTQLAGR